MLNLDNLPRTIQLVRAGQKSYPELNAAAADAVAAFAHMAYVPDGVPLLVMVDQTELPASEEYVCTADWRRVMDAIKRLEVRGAPAIGIAGAAALALRAAEFCWASGDAHRQDADDFERVFVIDKAAFDPELYMASLEFSANMIAGIRPTAVNLRWAIDRALAVARAEVAAGAGADAVAERLYDFARAMVDEDERVCRQIGAHGAKLLPAGARVLTHCNAGSLATAFFGTALGVVYAAAAQGQGKIERVYACETRPVNQGARLTVWELARAGVPVTLICDDMAAAAMAQRKVDAVLVGADRVAANGDVANKIGTLGLAVLARRFDVPFYVAAPTSTIDLATPRGADISIEQRVPEEVLPCPIDGVDVWNPAFDVTPAALITAIITERGVFNANEIQTFKNNFKNQQPENRE